MTYAVHPSAERDIAEASDFYEERAGIAVARRFLAEIDRVAKLVNRNPDAGVPLTKTRRMFHLSVFPYTVVYRMLAGDVQMLVVRHRHRKPSYGMSRR